MCRKLKYLISFVSVLGLVSNASGALPPDWLNQDIGTPSPPGSASESSGTFTVTGDGWDIWENSDAFHYVYKCLEGDGEMTARVASLTGPGTNGWAKAGVMMRETLDAGSKHAMMIMTGGNGGGKAFHCRVSTGGNTQSSHGGTQVSPPFWVKLKRESNIFTGYYSTDGTNWVQQPHDTGGDATTNPCTIDMAETVYIGLCLTSHQSGVMRTATFDNVTLVGNVFGQRKAYNPSPADGALHHHTWVGLEWSAGVYAVSHDVYFGDDFADVDDDTGGTFQRNQTATWFRIGSARSPYLFPGRTYYWRIDEVNDLDPNSPWKGEVWSFMTPPKTAYEPYPVDDIDFIDPNVTLSWETGFGAKLHNVYFGDNFANVNDADTSDTTGIYRCVQAATTYTPGPLALDSPYYWRVDEFDGSATYKGAVWSFTTARSGTGTIGREVFVRAIGPEEVVFDWSTDHCERPDYPDVPARAFRDADGKVQLIASCSANRRMIGNTLDSVEHDCNIVMNSERDPDPSKFNHGESIFSLYTLDGQTIYALVHNEYHGHLHPGQCPSGENRKCVYNAVTFAKSTDKGRTYSHPTAPDHLVATEPYPYEPDAGPRGMYSPSNIIHNPNSGYYYALVHRFGSLHKGGVCVMRTRTLDEPKSWRAWDGKDFSVRFINPYTEPNADPAQHIFQPVSPQEIDNWFQSLTFNTYLNKFLLVALDTLWDPERKKLIRGCYYSVSNDLIHWTPMKLLMEVKGGWPLDGQEDAFAYASLIDPNDTSRNFERTGQRPYLYYTHWHRDSGRDLVRVPIEFSYSPPPPPPDPLSEALDTALSFTTGGSADWFAQTTTSYYGADAAQSGDILNNQESWMQTTVSGTGTVKFYWMVSSEEDYDFLEFYIDGSLQEKISGSVDWQQMTYTITDSGLHTLEWQYIKDGSVDSGSDCGWVDKVEFVTN